MSFMILWRCYCTDEYGRVDTVYFAWYVFWKFHSYPLTSLRGFLSPCNHRTPPPLLLEGQWIQDIQSECQNDSAPTKYLLTFPERHGRIHSYVQALWAAAANALV